MQDNDTSRRRKFYDKMSEAYDLGSFEEFDQKMNSPESREKLWKYIDGDGRYDIGDFNHFDEAMRPVETQTVSPTTQAPGTLPGTDEWRRRTVDLPGDNPYNGRTYGEVYDSVIQDYGRNIAHPDVDPYAEARAQIMQAGITDDMKPDEADRLALDIREGYANRYASNGAREMVAALPDQVPNIDDLMDSQWYTRDLQGRISHEAARLGLRRENYVNYYVKPHIAKALSDRYGFDAGSAGHIAKRLLSQEDHTADQIRRREAVGIIAANAGERIGEQFQKIQQAADEQTRAEAEGSMMTPFGSAGQSMGAAVRNWQASDPEAVWQQVKPFFDDMGSWLGIVGNQQLFEQVSQMADSENIPVNTYIDQYVLPAYADTVKREFERIAVEREMPKNTFDYVMDKVGQSLVGTVGRWMVESKARMRAQDEALQMTDAGQNTDYTPGYGARVAGGTAEMMSDMLLPFGGPFGLATKAATKPLQGMTQALITSGWGPLKSRINESIARGAVSLGAFEGLKGVFKGAFDPEGYESVLAEDKRSASDILSDMLKGAWEGAVPSAVAGATMIGHPIVNKTVNGRGILANALGWGAGSAIDAVGATLLGALPRLMAGKEVSLSDEFADNFGQFLALGLHSMAKEFASLANGGRSWNGVEFTKDEIKFLEERYLWPLRQQIAEIEQAQSKKGLIERTALGLDAKESQRQAINSEGAKIYNDIMNSYGVPRELKVKVAQAMNEPIPESAMKPEVLESTDKALTQSVDLGWQELANYEYNRPGGVADKVKAGEPLTDYELTLRLIYQDNKAADEIAQKVLAGEEVSADEAGLLAAYNERINIIQRDYYQREKERLTAEFERENGLKKGTVDRMLEEVREGRSVEDPEALDKFNDMMREFGQSLDGYKAARDEAANVDQSLEAPADETPAGDSPKVNRVVDNADGETVSEEPVTEGNPSAPPVNNATGTVMEVQLVDGRRAYVADEDKTNGLMSFVDAQGRPITMTDQSGYTIDRFPPSFIQTDENGRLMITETKAEAPKTRKAEKEGPDGGIAAKPDGGIAAKYRIPLDKDANPDYERARPEDTFDALVEEFGEENAAALVKSEISDAKKRMPKPRSAEPVSIPGGLSMAEKTMLLRQQMERRKALEDEERANSEREQARIDYWNSVLEVPKTRKAEADRAARREKMMTPEGREELLSEAKTAQQRAAIAKEIYGDYFNENTGEPDTVEELVSMLLPYGKLNWEGYERGINHVRGLQEELGSQHTRGLSKDKGTAGFNSYLAKKGEGESLDEIVHEMYEDSTNLIGDEHRFTTEEIKDAVIDMLLSAEKPTDIRDYILNSRIATAEKTLRAELEREREDEEAAAGKGDTGLEGSHPIGHTSTPEQIAAEEGRVNTDPTDGQKEAPEDIPGEQMPFEPLGDEAAPFHTASPEDRPVEDVEMENALRDAFVDHLRSIGVEVSTGWQEGQRILDEYNGNGQVKKMGTSTRKRQNNILEYLKDRSLSEQQKQVADAFGGVSDRITLSVKSKDGKSRNIMFRQGNENRAGVKHSVFRHYNTESNGYTADEVTMIPEIIANGNRKQDQGNRVSYKYEKDGITYTVTTEAKGKNELFTNFYTNKKPSVAERGTSNTDNRHVQPQQTDSGAKVRQNPETSKDSGRKFFKTPDGHAYGFTYKGKIYIDPRIATSETPIHEYGHLWTEMKRRTAPEEWNRIKEVLLGDKVIEPIIERVRRDYPELTSEGREDDFVEEVLTQFSGKHGSERLRQIADEIQQEMGGDAAAKTIAEAAVRKMKGILDKFWRGIADMMGWKYTSAEEIADRMLYDLLSGKNPNEEITKAEEAEAVKPQKNDKTLMGVHNISEDKLKKAIKQGGLANPSMAVIDTNKGIHTDYGEISLIPRSTLIDAMTGRNAGTYAGDAWSPTYPSVSRVLTKQGDKHRMAIAKEFSGGDSETERHLGGVIYDYIEGNGDRMHWLFLKQKGMDPEIKPERTSHTHEEFEEIQKIFGDETSTLPSHGRTKEQDKALLDLMTRDYEKDIRENAKHIKDEAKREAYIKIELERKINNLVDKDGNLYFAPADTYVYENWRDEKKRKEPKPDWHMTDNEANYRVAKEGLAEEYEQWKEQLFDDGDIKEQLFAGWTPDGNKRYVANTVENASRLMNKEKDTNAYDQNGLNATRSSLLKRMKSLSDIRKAKHLLQGKEAYDSTQKEMSDELFDIISQISDMQKISDNRYMNIDYAEARLQEAITKRDPIGHLNKEYGYDIARDSELASQIMNFIEKARNLPVKYFETKFKRPVGLEEFAVAVVPEKTSPEVIEALKKAGLDVRTYDNTGTEEQKNANRTAATMEAVTGRDDIRFQKKTERYQLSETEKDAEGNSFYEKDGSVDLWTLPNLFARARRQAAPIRLTDRNMQHIINEHRKEIGSEKDVLTFLDEIFSNAPVLRRARGRGMFVVVEQDNTDKAAIIKLMPSETGDYYNVETAGYYRKNKWKDYEDVIADLREPDQSDAAADASKPQTPDKNGGEPINAETQTSSSEGKDTKNINTLQENREKSSDLGKTSSPEQIKEEELNVNVNPTEGQKEAGNYKMGHISLDGYNITIENPKGSVRSGVDGNGKAWSQEMHNTYGYIRGTEGVDGDHIDVFLSDNPTEGKVYVIDQVDPKTGEFDEHKVMYSFGSEEEARQAYLSNYEEGWKGLGNITEVSKEDFKKWVESSHRKTKPFADYKIAKKQSDDNQESASDGIKFQRVSNPEPEMTPEERQYWKKWDEAMKKWKERNAIAEDAQEPGEETPKQPDESMVDYVMRIARHRIEKAKWKTAPRLEDFRQARSDKDTVEAARENLQRYPYSQSARMRLAAAEFQHIRSAMGRQKAYDKATVKAVTDFAQEFMRMGFGDNLSRGEIERMLSSVKNATGAKDIRREVDNIMNILTDNYLRNLDQQVTKLSSTKELSKTAQGVEKQGKLELKGQRMIQAFRDAREKRMSVEDLRTRMAEVSEKMNRNDEEAPMWEQEYEGLSIALQYAENIEGSRSEWADLDLEYKDAVKGYRASGRSYKAQQELLESLDRAMMENKLERIGMFGEIIGRLQGNIAESMQGAREFVEREKQRIKRIQDMANADLDNVSTRSSRKETKTDRLLQNDIVRLVLSPLGTFEQFLKQFGSRDARGVGRLHEYYIRGFMDAQNNAYTGEVKAREEMDAKAREIFGGKVKHWSDLYDISRQPGIDVEYIDGGETVKENLSQGNMLYIYMANKMTDGKMKLRAMGITEEQVEQLKEKIDPRLVQLGDWLQSEYLVNKRVEYNKVYERMFGAPMAAIENYFPIKVNRDASYQDAEKYMMSKEGDKLPSSITGSIIKRRRNALPLDILHTDALDLAMEHIQDMEHWKAQAEWNRDVKDLLSYTAFRNKVKNMKTIYGSGSQLWNDFFDAATIATGDYVPKRGAADKALTNIAKGITGAKINFRIYTAFKQLQSIQAFVTDVPVKDLAKAMMPQNYFYYNFKWAKENIPVFRKRWESRQIGDTRLMDDPTDWKIWKKKWMQEISKYGMYSNAAIDALTCAAGAKATYDSKYMKYKEIGASDEVARKRALQDAAIAYNLTQQSSEGAFVSAIQKDRTLTANALTVFRNGPFSYTRQAVDALRNLKHLTQKGYREDSIKFTAAKLRDELGIDEAQAEKAAELQYAHTARHEVAKALNMMFGITITWNLLQSVPYLIFGDDGSHIDAAKDVLKGNFRKAYDEFSGSTKGQMWADAVAKGIAGGPVEGLAAGNIWSDMMGRALSEKTRTTFSEQGLGAAFDEALKQAGDYEVNPLPMMADIQSMIEKMGYDKYAAAQDLFNIIAQSYIGVNPQTFTDAWNAVIDYGNPSWMPFVDNDKHNSDLSNSKEIALFIMRVLNAPTNSWRNKYIDELGMNAEDAKKLPYEEMARRYSNYKHWKDAPIMGWLRGDEARQKKMESIRKQFDKAVQERMGRLTDEGLQKTFDNTADLTERKMLGKEAARREDSEDKMTATTSKKEKTKKAVDLYARHRTWQDLTDDLELARAQREAAAVSKQLKELRAEAERFKTEDAEDSRKKAVEDFEEANKDILELQKDIDKAVKEIKKERDKLTGVEGVDDTWDEIRRLRDAILKKIREASK